MSVISFEDAKQARKPHWAGRVKCVSCGHEADTAAPMETTWVDCESCGLTKATPKHVFEPSKETDLLLGCLHCGSHAMNLYKRDNFLHVMCIVCGIDLTEVAFNG